MTLKQIFAALVVGVASFGSAQADVIQVGNLSNSAAYTNDCTFWCVQRFQQIYNASLFTGPVDISRVSFFASDGGTWNGTSTWRMTLSTTGRALGGLSNAFNANVGADAAVFDTETFAVGTQAFGSLVSFTGLFAYDQSMGNLLVDIERISGSGQGVGLQGNFNNGGAFDRAYSFGSNVNADGLNEHYGNRTEFAFAAATAVPEPAPLALFAVGLIGLCAMRRKVAK